MLGQQIDVFFEGRDIGLASLLGQPASQCFERPDVADARLRLDDRVNLGDGLERLGVVERLARRKGDQNVDRIGAGEFGVEAAACRNSLPLVGHLVGQSIARLQVGVNAGEPANHQ